MLFANSVVLETRKTQHKMARRSYSEEIKEIAIQRYINGESSYLIAKDLGLPYPDLVRKWAETWRKKHGLSANDYRKENIGEEVDMNMKLRNQLQSLNEDIEALLKVIVLMAKEEIKDRMELLSQIKQLIQNRPNTDEEGI